MSNTVKLKDVCEFKRGLTYSKKDEVDYSNNIVVRATNIDLKNNKLNLAQLKYIKESVKINEDKILKKGDILICTASGSKSHLGKVALIDKDIKMAFGGFMGVLRTSEKCLPKFLYNILISQEFKKILLSNADGANINNLRFSQIENFEFALPSLKEQQRIIDKLDAAFADIDKSIVTTEKNINNSKKLFLNNLDNLVNEPNLGKKILLREVCTLSQGLAINKGTKHLLVAKSTKPLIRIKDLISNTVQKYIDNKYENKKTSVNKEDLIFTRTGSLGLVFRGREGVLHNNSFKVEPKNILSKDYMYWWLQNSSFLKKIHSLAGKAAQPDISHKLFGSQYIIVPTLQKQKEILEKVEKCMLDTKTLAELYKNKLKNFIQLKQSILKQELNGEFKKAS
jgi:type I restriction enzyme S subunit